MKKVLNASELDNASSLQPMPFVRYLVRRQTANLHVFHRRADLVRLQMLSAWADYQLNGEGGKCLNADLFPFNAWRLLRQDEQSSPDRGSA